jgi:hypothetical protein
MRVYLAGKMTGRVNWGFDHFDRVRDDYRARGFEVLSPADHDRLNGFEGIGLDGTPQQLEELGIEFDLVDALEHDFKMIASGDGVVLLKGWEHSKGARAELAFAAALGKMVQYEGDTDWHLASDVFLHHWIEK